MHLSEQMRPETSSKSNNGNFISQEAEGSYHDLNPPNLNEPNNDIDNYETDLTSESHMLSNKDIL